MSQPAANMPAPEAAPDAPAANGAASNSAMPGKAESDGLAFRKADFDSLAFRKADFDSLAFRKADFDSLAFRKAMIESQLKTCGVVSPRLVTAFYAVAREDFVPAARRNLAYGDGAQPLGHGRELMPALSLGYMLQEAAVRPEDRVLVIASGTGYSAAILSYLSASVTALESDAALAAASRVPLEARGVTLVEGPLEAGWPTAAPYGFILIDGAIEMLHPSVIAQLAEGGRIAAILVGSDGVSRAALGLKRSDRLHFEPIAECGAALLPPFRKPAVFQF